MKMRLAQQSLRRTTDFCHTVKIGERHFRQQTNCREFKLKVAAITNGLADNESNIEPQRVTIRVHMDYFNKRDNCCKH